ncbi:hypothetical protein LUZ60_006788 [Juncus effusus]|nr:hypothetical protein LUZ60_006788 [Juncus effusus]
MANSTSGGGRAEAERWLEIAGRLLAARDLVGSKRFAERAMEADPMLDGVDSVLSVADVLLASQRRIGAHHVDWYAVLGVDPSADESTIRQEHRRLAGLLRLNTHAGADSASHLVADALSFLTDPSKKKLLDQELKKQSLKPAPNPNSSNKPKKDKEKEREKSKEKEKEKSAPPVKVKKAYVANAFWTACPFCCHLHQYAKSYKNKSLLCPNSACRRPFHASELPVPATCRAWYGYVLFRMGIFSYGVSETEGFKRELEAFPSRFSLES